MKITILDTVTGKTVTEKELSPWEITDGNWSCDCNRELRFGVDTGEGFCIGSKRYLVIEVEQDCSGQDREMTLLECNSDYPKELLAKFFRVDMKTLRTEVPK
jgi:hypothetical protein